MSQSQTATTDRSTELPKNPPLAEFIPQRPHNNLTTLVVAEIDKAVIHTLPVRWVLVKRRLHNLLVGVVLPHIPPKHQPLPLLCLLEGAVVLLAVILARRGVNDVAVLIAYPKVEVALRNVLAVLRFATKTCRPHHLALGLDGHSGHFAKVENDNTDKTD